MAFPKRGPGAGSSRASLPRLDSLVTLPDDSVDYVFIACISHKIRGGEMEISETVIGGGNPHAHGTGPVRRMASPYRGVSFHSCTQRWRGRIKNGTKSEHLGYFASDLEAALAYNKAARNIHGDNALQNKGVEDVIMQREDVKSVVTQTKKVPFNSINKVYDGMSTPHVRGHSNKLNVSVAPLKLKPTPTARKINFKPRTVPVKQQIRKKTLACDPATSFHKSAYVVPDAVVPASFGTRLNPSMLPVLNDEAGVPVQSSAAAVTTSAAENALLKEELAKFGTPSFEPLDEAHEEGFWDDRMLDYFIFDKDDSALECENTQAAVQCLKRTRSEISFANSFEAAPQRIRC
mmetsp:Transcript_53391/g.116556  ORF Transcript_53391/g.116556 Transcript_53391/m.116556 type:complete len:348 (+) Transcript_53391:203-1246(+)